MHRILRGSIVLRSIIRQRMNARIWKISTLSILSTNTKGEVLRIHTIFKAMLFFEPASEWSAPKLRLARQDSIWKYQSGRLKRILSIVPKWTPEWLILKLSRKEIDQLVKEREAICNKLLALCVAAPLPDLSLKIIPLPISGTIGEYRRLFRNCGTLQTVRNLKYISSGASLVLERAERPMKKIPELTGGRDPPPILSLMDSLQSGQRLLSSMISMDGHQSRLSCEYATDIRVLSTPQEDAAALKRPRLSSPVTPIQMTGGRTALKRSKPLSGDELRKLSTCVNPLDPTPTIYPTGGLITGKTPTWTSSTPTQITYRVSTPPMYELPDVERCLNCNASMMNGGIHCDECCEN